ncbi:MAG: ABC transporter ATP-binding protein [Xanthomonadales bacterium]|nr:ABC transporter ATP-binding protein [Xanthomonadales bacterium]
MWRLLAGLPPADPAVVLDGITLEVRRGESLGIVGENGAGKSTLLKVLTGVLAPTSGQVELAGSVAALLELGAGFHAEFTGRENVEMAGALMGYRPAELRAQMDRILAFADIGRYIDEPVKHYSSGMVVRLGFALVAARRPDLLITDEVLAVGDEAFQRKCVRWIEDYLAGGGTLMLVSHSMYHVQKLCRRAVWIQRGRIEAIGDVHEVTQRYLAWQETRIAADSAAAQRGASGLEFQTRTLAVNGVGEGSPLSIDAGGTIEVVARVRSSSGRVPVLGVGIVRGDGTPVYGVTSEMDGAAPRREGADGYRFVLRFPALALLPGTYTVRAHAMDPEALRLFDTVEQPFTVRGRSRELGLVRLPHDWERDP